MGTSGVPINSVRNTALLASLSVKGIGMESTVKAAALMVYFKQILLVCSARGIMIMNNLSEHKGAWVRPLIEAHCCQLRLLSKCSTNFLQIEPFPRSKPFCGVWVPGHKAL
jgi:hypothetical protein